MEPYPRTDRGTAVPAGYPAALQVDVDEVCRLTTAVGIFGACADSATTYVGLRWLGTVEGKPAVQSLIDGLGLGVGLALRTVIAVGLLAVLWRGTRGWLRAVGLSGVAGIYVWVVGWNLHIMAG